MAIGGFAGPFLAGMAGLGEAVRQAEERRRQKAHTDLLLAEFGQKQRLQQQEQAALAGAYGGLSQFRSLTGPQFGPIGGGGPVAGDSGGSPGNAGYGSSPAGPPSVPEFHGGRADTLLPARGTPARDRLLELISRDESGNRNIPQRVVPPGGGYNPSVGRVTGPSTAGGYYQITDSTWRDTPTGRSSGFARAIDAPASVQKEAANDLLDSRGLRPWLPYNKRLRDDLMQFAQSLQQQGANPNMPQAQGGATRVANMLGPQNIGRLSGEQVAQAIDKAMPGADPATKMMAVQFLMKFLEPQAQQDWDRYKFDITQAEKQREFDIRERELRQNRDELREYRRENLDIHRTQMDRDKAADWEVLTDPTTNQQYRYNKRTGEARSLTGNDPYVPGGAKKIESGGGPRSFEAFRTPDGDIEYIRKGDPVPKGYQRDNRRYVGAQGMALQTFIDEFTKENGRPPGSQDIRQWQAQNRMATAEAGSVGARTGTLEVAANAAEAMGPLLIEASEKIDRTEYSDINKIILAYEEKTGSPEVIQYGEMLNTMRYLYARALSPTGQARVADLQNFDRIMNTAWTKGQIRAGVEQINKSIEVERQAIEKTRQQISTGDRDQKKAPASAQQTSYKSPDEVKAAVEAGKLDRAAAIKILRDQFGMQ